MSRSFTNKISPLAKSISVLQGFPGTRTNLVGLDEPPSAFALGFPTRLLALALVGIVFLLVVVLVLFVVLVFVVLAEVVALVFVLRAGLDLFLFRAFLVALRFLVLVPLERLVV